MKKNLLLIAAIFFMATNSFATTFTVTVADFTFSPSSVTMHVGDMITWVWSSGTHTTTSTTIPSGATPWNANINSTSTSFSYMPTVVGTYNYQCNFHVSMGMVGTITVLPSTGVAPVNAAPLFSMFPNPASGTVNFQFNSTKAPVSVTITNVVGKDVMSKVYNGVNNAEISLEGIPNGTYYIKAVQGEMLHREKLVVMH